MTSAPTIIAVHGVGLCPALFDAVPFRHAAVSVVRPGYDDVPAVDSFAGQVQFVSELVKQHAPAVLVGVSGGATIALACATQRTKGLVGAVSHEPLIGALAAQLNYRVVTAGQRLAESPNVESAIEFVRNLYGPQSWDSLEESFRLWAEQHAHTICEEVAQFGSFQPTAEHISSLSVPHLTTVGALSATMRHDVCGLLQDHGSRSALIDGAGHLVLAEQPRRFAQIVDAFIEQLPSAVPLMTHPTQRNQ